MSGIGYSVLAKYSIVNCSCEGDPFDSFRCVRISSHPVFSFALANECIKSRAADRGAGGAIVSGSKKPHTTDDF